MKCIFVRPLSRDAWLALPVLTDAEAQAAVEAGTALHAAIETDLRDLFAEAQRDPAAFNRAVKAAVEETVEKAVAEEAPDSEVPGLHDMRRVALEKANKRIIELQEEAELNRRTLVAVSRDLASKTVECQSVLTRLENLEEEFVEAQQRTDEQAKALVNKGMRIDALIRENEAKDNTHREQYGTLKRAHETQAQTIRDQRAHAAKLEETCREYEKNILDLNKRLEYAEKQINDRGAQIERQSYEIDNKHRELAERKRQVSILTHARFAISEKMKQCIVDLGEPQNASYSQWSALTLDVNYFADALAAPMTELAVNFPARPEHLERADAKPDLDDLI